MSTLEQQIGPCHIARLSNEGGRAANEDCYGSWGTEDGTFGCWVVADGLGGHRGGEIASALAVQAVVERFKRYPVFSSEAIREAIERANQAILKGQQENPRHFGMRTTIVVLLIEGRYALWGHVGDSRLYHFRKGMWLFQTKDHSVTQAFYDAGHIETKDLRTDENRSSLTRVLGNQETAEPEVLKKPIELTPEDSLLLCTDGLWEHIEEESMKVDLEETWATSPQDWLDRLEERLLQTATGEFDNYTAYAVFFRPPPGSLPAVAAPSTATKHPAFGSAAVPNQKRVKALGAIGFLLVSLAALAFFFLPEKYIPKTPGGGSNRPPEANQDTVTTDPGVPVSILVLENDQDPDQDKLMLAAVGAAEHGTVEFEGQVIVYTPHPETVGMRETFTYEVTDGTAYVRGLVEVRVRAPAGSIVPPEPKNDEATTQPQTAVVIDVLQNDYDANDDPLTVSTLEQPSHGNVERTTEGSVVYTPEDGFDGVDEFRYQVSDGRDTAWATVRVKVETPNQKPEAGDDRATTEAGKAVTVEVLKNDTDPDEKPEPLRIDRIEVETGGTAEISEDGKSILFTPKEDFAGEAIITYVVTDGEAEGTATLKVQVAQPLSPPLPPPPPPPAENQPPTAAPDPVDSASLSLEIDVLANDTDPENQPLTLKGISKPSHGTARIQNGLIVYKRNPTFKGTDTFTYTVSDGQKEATGKVTVTFASVLKAGFISKPLHGLSYSWIPGDPGKNIGPFWIGTTEVTRDAYKKFIAAQKLPMPPQDTNLEGDFYPVIEVSWSDAKEFCKWSGGRLPTPAEWQYAALEGQEQTFPWGASDPSCTAKADDGANYKGCPGQNPLLPVSSFGENQFGLYDVIGNVWEWCEGATMLGGSFKTSRGNLTDMRKKPDKGFVDVGFRCVRDKAP